MLASHEKGNEHASNFIVMHDALVEHFPVGDSHVCFHHVRAAHLDCVCCTTFSNNGTKAPLHLLVSAVTADEASDSERKDKRVRERVKGNKAVSDATVVVVVVVVW